MSLTWIDWDDFFNTYFDGTEHHSRKDNLKKVVDQFHEKYPSPEIWLNTPTEEKVVFISHGYSDLNYIASWAWENDIYKDPLYRSKLFEYFKDHRHSNSKVPLWLARKLDLLTEDELSVIRSYKKNHGVKSFAIHCLFLMKPFREFADEDIFEMPKVLNIRSYTANSIQNIRIQLGYSSSIVKRKSRKGNWDILKEHPVYSDVFKEFYEFLLRSEVRKKYLKTMGSALKQLCEFLKKQSLNDCSNFGRDEFKAFTEHLREQVADESALLIVYKLKKFFSWGTTTHPFFPDTLDYPTQYWKDLLKKVKTARKDKDGRSFSDLDLPKHIVRIVYNYEPQDEIADLCRCFWLIIASCPCRFSYILNLGADDTLQSLPNAKDTYGIYSRLADKAGNKYGQFPILDDIGQEAIEYLQLRAKLLELQPIRNPDNENSYIHLFQLQKSPWILDRNMITKFFNDVVKSELLKIYPHFENIQASAHGFRHYLLTEVALATGDIETVQTAAGHHSEKMTREYLKSKVSRTALLFRVIDKYDSKEITGKFYLRLVELLSSEEAPVDEMFRALTMDMKLDEFINRYGKRLDMGYCFSSDDCSNWLKCWNCTNFLITRQEITGAIKTLSHQIINLREMQKNTKDFTYEHPIIQNQLKIIALIIKRLTELDLTEEQINKMIDNYLQHKEIEEGVVCNVS